MSRFERCPFCSLEFGSASLTIHVKRCRDAPPGALHAKALANYLSASSKAMAAEPPHEFAATADLIACRKCGRTFSPERVSVHEGVCMRERRRRKVWRMSRQRSLPPMGSWHSTWRWRHQELQNAIRAARCTRKGPGAAAGSPTLSSDVYRPYARNELPAHANYSRSLVPAVSAHARRTASPLQARHVGHTSTDLIPKQSPARTAGPGVNSQLARRFQVAEFREYMPKKPTKISPAAQRLTNPRRERHPSCVHRLSLECSGSRASVSAPTSPTAYAAHSYRGGFADSVNWRSHAASLRPNAAGGSLQPRCEPGGRERRPTSAVRLLTSPVHAPQYAFSPGWQRSRYVSK